MKENKIEKLQNLARLLRYYSLIATTSAGSGHPSSSLSAADLMAVLFFDKFRFNLNRPFNDNNDRLIFSKGHASPLFYALYAAAGKLTEKELLTLRKINSPLEGHPTPAFRYTEAATGSLGQGLSIGVGMALAKAPHVYVLLGDGEMAEGSVWEAMEIAAYYRLSNLTAVLDVNRLGQSQETMYGWDTKTYEIKARAFGWETIVIDGHNIRQIQKAFNQPRTKKPLMIIAKTVKGKGISFLENKDGWHGKALDSEKLQKALVELGSVDTRLCGQVQLPVKSLSEKKSFSAKTKLSLSFKLGDQIATREAYGEALKELGKISPQVVVLDGDTKNSTYSEKFKEKFPKRFFEMFIAEQNMVGAALGMSKRGFIPFASTFAAFFTRTFDQVRMAALSRGNIKLCGSHAGVSIGEDGASQMGLEDMAMMRAVYNSTVLYPADAVSTAKLVGEMAKTKGVTYLRTTRGKTPVIYNSKEEFPIGGSKTHKTKKEKVTVVAAGITLHEALAAQKELTLQGIGIRVIDAYSVKPLDGKVLQKAIRETKAIITVEDHFIEGGLGDAVLQALAEEKKVPVYKLGVSKMPHSGKPKELLSLMEIDKVAIVKKVKEILK